MSWRSGCGGRGLVQPSWWEQQPFSRLYKPMSHEHPRKRNRWAMSDRCGRAALTVNSYMGFHLRWYATPSSNTTSPSLLRPPAHTTRPLRPFVDPSCVLWSTVARHPRWWADAPPPATTTASQHHHSSTRLAFFFRSVPFPAEDHAERADTVGVHMSAGPCACTTIANTERSEVHNTPWRGRVTCGPKPELCVFEEGWSVPGHSGGQ